MDRYEQPKHRTRSLTFDRTHADILPRFGVAVLLATALLAGAAALAETPVPGEADIEADATGSITIDPADVTEAAQQDDQSQAETAAADATEAANDDTTPTPAGGILYEDDARSYCIGGSLCETYCEDNDDTCEPVTAYQIRLDQPVHISRIQLFAHDQIGESRRANLVVRVNGEVVDEQPVYRRGALVSLDIDRIGQLVTIETRHNQHGLEGGSDEALIRDVFVFGGTDDRTVE
ncbi:MAG: hypothetical protein AAFX39_00770 [Pseudomonadota bacterium]